MRDVWKSALEWYIYNNDSTEKERYARLVMEVKQELSHLSNKGDLFRHYMTVDGLCERVAARLYPGEFWLDARRTDDVAYGLRCLEISTGKRIDVTRKAPSRWMLETVA